MQPSRISGQYLLGPARYVLVSPFAPARPNGRFCLPYQARPEPESGMERASAPLTAGEVPSAVAALVTALAEEADPHRGAGSREIEIDTATSG